MADKNDPNNPGPFKGTFSFVNKDAGNMNSKDHNAAVLWHVQHRYERWKKRQLAKNLRDSLNVPCSASSSSSSTGGPTGESEPYRRLPSRPGSSHTLEGPAQTELNITPFDIPAWTSLPNYMLQTETSISMTPRSTPSGDRTPSASDSGPPSAFGQLQTTDLCHTGTPIINELMAFAYQIFVPSAWPNEGAASTPSYELTRSWYDLIFSNEDECYPNAVFSVLAGAMVATTGNEILRQHSQMFQAKAMFTLRTRIQKQQDLQNPATFRAILWLFTSETVDENAAAARVHLKMLRHLIIEAGGIITLDSWLRENIVCCDVYFAIRYGTRPYFSAAEWTPGGLNVAWKSHVATAASFPEATSEIDMSVENHVLRNVISDLRELVQVHDYVAENTVPPDEPLLRWKQLRKFDCISRVADYQVNLTIYPHLYVDPYVQLAICSAILLWISNVFGSPEPIRLGTKLFLDLKKRLEKCNEDFSIADTYPQLKFWLMDVGVKAGQTLPGLETDKTWFSKESQQIYDSMISENTLKLFLYSDRLQQELDNGVKCREVDVRKGIYLVSGCSWRAPLEGWLTQELYALGEGKGKE